MVRFIRTASYFEIAQSECDGEGNSILGAHGCRAVVDLRSANQDLGEVAKRELLALSVTTDKLMDKLIDSQVFYTLLNVKVLTEQFRQTCNHIRPHISLGYLPCGLYAFVRFSCGCLTNITDCTKTWVHSMPSYEDSNH